VVKQSLRRAGQLHMLTSTHVLFLCVCIVLLDFLWTFFFDEATSSRRVLAHTPISMIDSVGFSRLHLMGDLEDGTK